MRLMGSHHAPLSPARSDHQIHSSNIQVVTSYLHGARSCPNPVQTQAGFQGMTVHWIAVMEGRWKLKVAVVGFKALSAGHNRNIGRVCSTTLG